MTGFWVRLVVLATVVAVGTSCTGNSPSSTGAAPTATFPSVGSPAPSTGPILDARPKNCPAPHFTPPPVPRSAQELVPGSPVAAVGCFEKDRVVFSPDAIIELTALLNGLRHVSPNTPICLALGPSYMLFFTYADDGVQLVQVPTICAMASNGKLLARPTTRLLKWLRHAMKTA